MLDPDGPIDRRELPAVVAAFAGEIMAADDPVDLADLADALSAEVLADRSTADVAEAVLAMVRTYSMRRRMGRGGPARAPRRAYDTTAVSPPPD